jgi:hypothetical protein
LGLLLRPKQALTRIMAVSLSNATELIQVSRPTIVRLTHPAPLVYARSMMEDENVAFWAQKSPQELAAVAAEMHRMRRD